MPIPENQMQMNFEGELAFLKPCSSSSSHLSLLGQSSQLHEAFSIHGYKGSELMSHCLLFLLSIKAP